MTPFASIQQPIKSFQPPPRQKTLITPSCQFRRGETRGDFARHGPAMMTGIYRVAPWVGGCAKKTIWTCAQKPCESWYCVKVFHEIQVKYGLSQWHSTNFQHSKRKTCFRTLDRCSIYSLNNLVALCTKSLAACQDNTAFFIIFLWTVVPSAPIPLSEVECLADSLTWTSTPGTLRHLGKCKCRRCQHFLNSTRGTHKFHKTVVHTLH